jgi:hypothetical protein
MHRSETPPSVPAASAAPPQALEEQQLDDVTAGVVRQTRQLTMIQELGPAGLVLASDASVPTGRGS